MAGYASSGRPLQFVLPGPALQRAKQQPRARQASTSQSTLAASSTREVGVGTSPPRSSNDLEEERRAEVWCRLIRKSEQIRWRLQVSADLNNIITEKYPNLEYYSHSDLESESELSEIEGDIKLVEDRCRCSDNLCACFRGLCSWTCCVCRCACRILIDPYLRTALKQIIISVVRQGFKHPWFIAWLTTTGAAITKYFSIETITAVLSYLLNHVWNEPGAADVSG